MHNKRENISIKQTERDLTTKCNALNLDAGLKKRQDLEEGVRCGMLFEIKGKDVLIPQGGTRFWKIRQIRQQVEFFHCPVRRKQQQQHINLISRELITIRTFQRQNYETWEAVQISSPLRSTMNYLGLTPAVS